MQTCTDRGRRRVEDLCELRAVHVLPVVQLEQGLLFDWKMLERVDQAAVFLVARNARAGRRNKLRDRRQLEVELGVATLTCAQNAVELVTRDREEVGAERRLPTELILC